MAGILILLLALPLVVRDQYYMQLVVMVLVYAFFAQAWNIVGGYAGQMSLGHSAFVGTGAYVSTLLFSHLGVTPWIGLLIGGLVAASLAMVISYPAFRLRGPYYTLTTIAFAQIILISVSSTERVLGLDIRGARGLLVPLRGQDPSVMQFGSKAYYYYLILGLLVIVTVVSALIRNSKFGLYLLAIKGSQEASEAAGINTTLYKLLAAAMSAFFCGTGGAFLAQLVLYVDPVRVFGLDLSVEIALLAIIGGAGTAWGPLLGAFLLRPISEATQALLGGTYLGIHLAVYGCALILAIMFLPTGLHGLLQKAFRQRIDGLRQSPV